MKKHNVKTHAVIILTAAFTLMNISAGDTYGEVRFKSYEHDRSMLERYIERAESAEDMENWDNIVESGLEAMEAEWERDANLKIERALLNGEPVDVEALQQDKAEAFAEWETALHARIAEERGAWYARRQNIIYGELDRESVRALLSEADESAGSAERDEKLITWDGVVESGMDEIIAEWEDPFVTLIQSALDHAADLDEESRAAFEREIERIEMRFRDQFRLEMNRLVFGERNRLFDRIYSDAKSLRNISEQNSAEAVTNRILGETRKELQEDEKSILETNIGEYDESNSIDFSDLGDNWQDEIKRLMELGLGRWRNAQDELLKEMILWKENAEYAFEEGNKKWEEAYIKLTEAKEKWEDELTERINLAIEEWRLQEESLDENIEIAEEDLDNYIEVLNEQWDSHSAGLVNMAISGASAYGEALDNIEWLDEMLSYYRNTATFAQSQTCYYYRRADGTYCGTNNSVLFNTLESNSDYIAYKNSCINHPWNEGSFTITVKFKFIGNTNNGAIEHYNIDFDSNLAWWNTTSYLDWYYTDANYAYYLQEKERWEGIRDNFSEIVNDAEQYMHNRNMLGTIDSQGNPGAGFLTNSQGEEGLIYNENGELESDTYLMTKAELEYEKARRDMQYWEKRLDIAKAVLKYAFPEDEYEDGNPYAINGKREDASVTENRVEEMRDEMDTAKAAYNASLIEVEDIVKQMKSAGENISALAALLDAKKTELDRAREEYMTLQRALVLLENGESVNYLRNEIIELEKKLIDSEKELREKRLDYHTKMRGAEVIDNMAKFSDIFNENLAVLRESEEKFNAYKSIVQGEETDDALILWYSAIDAAKEDIWGNDADIKYSELTELYTAWETAAPEEKDESRGALAKFIRREYSSLKTACGTAQATVDIMLNKELSADNILSRREKEVLAPAYSEYAEINLDALSSVMDTLNSLAPEAGYDGLMAGLSAKLEGLTYAYGGDNGEFLTAQAAYDWAEKHIQGLDDSNRTDYIDYLNEQIALAAELVAFYVDYSEFDRDLCTKTADGGDALSKAILKEYYSGGASIAVLPFLMQYDYSVSEHQQIFQAENRFTAQNEMLLYCNEGILLEDYRSRIIEAINESLPDITELDPETINGLDSEEMRILAEALEKFMVTKAAQGNSIPAAISALIYDILELKRNLDEYDYIDKNKEEDAEELLNSTEAASELADNALNFVLEAYNLLTNPENTAVKNAEQILEIYNDLDEATLEELAKYTDEGNPVNEFMVSLGSIEEALFEYELHNLAADFISPTNSFTLDEFINTRCGDYADDEKERAKSLILGYSEKIWYHDRNIAGSLETFLDSRAAVQGYSGGLYSEIKRYVLTDRYLDILNAGIPAFGFLNDEFKDFSKYFHFEIHLQALIDDYESAEDKATFLSGLVNDYILAPSEYIDPANSEGYLLFAEDYYNGSTSSYAYLPPEAQFFTAFDDYYSGIFTGGDLLNTEEEIAAYIDEYYISLGFNPGIDSAIRSYIEKIDAIDDYYGSDVKTYIARLSEDDVDDFRKYYYITQQTGQDLLVPGWDIGLDAVGMGLNADLYLTELSINEYTEEIFNIIGEAINALGKVSDGRAEEAEFARSLAAYQNDPAVFSSYRNFLMPDSWRAPVDDDGRTVWAEAVDLYQKNAGGDTYRDEYDNGAIHTLYFVDVNEKDGEPMLESMRIEMMNEIANRLKYLWAAAEAPAANGSELNPRTVAGFIDEVNTFIDTPEEEEKLQALINNVNTIRFDLGSDALTSIAGEIYNTASMLNEYKNSIVSKGVSFEQMRGVNKNTLRANLKTASDELARIQGEYDSMYDNSDPAMGLKAAQEEYSALNNEYIEMMNQISENYADYKNKEYEYEKAYAVWEYANTPYLNESSAYSGTVGEGAIVGIDGETVENLDDLVSPDAKENYTCILSEYNKAEERFTQAENELQNQKTVDDLHGDEEYMALREKLKRKMESFIRMNRADILTQKDLEDLRLDLEKAKQNYDAAKLAAFGLSSFGNKESKINTVLSHITAGNINGYLNVILLEKAMLDVNTNYVFPWPPIADDLRLIHEINYAHFEKLNNTAKTKKITFPKNITGNKFKANLAGALVYCIAWLGRYDLCDKVITYYYQKVPEFLKEYLTCYVKFIKVRNAKSVVDDKTAKIAAIDSIKNLTAVKNTLRGAKYQETNSEGIEDVSHIYDSSISFTPDEESVNITSLKDESGRYSVSEVAHVVAENYRIQMENIKKEYYTLCNELVSSNKYDNTLLLRDQESLYWEILTYARDFTPTWQESYKVSGYVSYTKTVTKQESQSRSYEGYRNAAAELVHNENGMSIDDRIVQALIAQNEEFQEQAWDHQKTKFNERKRRWMEVVSFIKNRGERDWNNRMIKFANQWRKWKIESREQIEEGEEEWFNTSVEFSKAMNAWQNSMAESSSLESARYMYSDLETKLGRYINNLNRSLPENVEIDIDTEKILNDALRNLPVSDIGILADSASTLDTTAGFAEMLSLGLSFDLHDKFEEQMEDYEKRMTIMQNLRMTEVFQEIIENFNKQLDEANRSVYDQVSTDLRYSKDLAKAPFKRDSGKNRWTIRYISDYSLVDGKEYKTYRFDDFVKYVDNSVYLKPLKNGLGGEVDFNDPSTYVNIDAEMLALFVDLEIRHLNDSIENVFKSGTPDEGAEPGAILPDDGLFTRHVKGQFNRLQEKFGKGFQKWVEGEAKASGNPFNAPIVSGGPSPRVVAQVGATVVASVYAGPLGGAAVSAAFTAYDVQQGNLSWKQAGVQIAISFAAAYAGGAVATGAGSQLLGTMASQAVNTAASGIDYEADGSVGWDNDQFKSGVKTGIVNMALTYATSNSTFISQNQWLTSSTSAFMNSGMDADNGSWWKIGWKEDSWKDAGAAAIAAAAATYASGKLAGDNTSGGTPGTEQTDFSETFMASDYANHLLYNTINSGMMSLYNMAAHDMSWNEASSMTGFWEGMTYQTSDIGGFLGTKAWQQTDTYKEAEKKRKEEREKAKAKESDQASSDPKDDPLDTIETMLGGLYESIKGGLSNLGEMVDDFFFGEETQAKDQWVMTDSGPALLKADGTYDYNTPPLNEADLYAAMYGGEVDMASDVKTYQDEGIVEYIDKIETNGLTYEEAMSGVNSNGELDINKFVTEKGKRDGAIESVNAYYKKLLDESKDLEDSERLEYIVNNLKLEYSDMKFQDQTHLSYTFAGIMANLGNTFDYKGDDAIKYDGAAENTTPFNSSGFMNANVGSLDCVAFTVLGLNILGLVDDTAPNVQHYNPDNEGPYYFDEDVFREISDKIITKTVNGIPDVKVDSVDNAVKNLAANKALFERIEYNPDLPGTEDLTGTIGITEGRQQEYFEQIADNNYQISSNTGWVSHSYTSLRDDGLYITHSSSGGVRSDLVSRNYQNRTRWYLRLKLSENRRR